MRVLGACPVCGEASRSVLRNQRTTQNPKDPARWTVCCCQTCKHGYLDPQPDVEELASYYGPDYGPYETHHGLSDDLGRVINEVKKSGEYRHVRIRAGQHILDVGCGGGSFLQVAKAMGAECEGVEPSQYGAERARRSGLQVYHGTLDEYCTSRSTNNKFDLITFSHVLEHLHDPIDVLRSARSLLSHQGVIWLAVPNGQCAVAKRLKWRWHSSDLPIHLMHFSLESMTKTAELAGLHVASLETYSFPKSVRSSMLQTLRWCYLIPRAVGRLLVSDQMAALVGKRMDARREGEAILAVLKAITT